MIKKQIKKERSPFHKTRNMKTPRGSPNIQTQVSQDMFNDFMKYARHYNAEHPTDKGLSNKANPLKHIVNEFLNNNALERKCFENLYVIMACNEIDFNKNIAKPDVDGAIIGFVEHPEKFTKFEPFRAVHDNFNKSKTIYSLADFNKDTFDMLNVSGFDREVFFGIEPYFYKSFEDLKTALTRTYEYIDFDNARICMFNVNNYLDILKDGVYVSEGSTYAHEGVVVLLDSHDYYKDNRVVFRINWSYNAGVFTCKLDVEDVGFFNTKVCGDLPVQVCRDYWDITSGFLSISAKKERQYKDSNLRLLQLQQELEKEQRNNAELKQWLEDNKDY
ncbi:MAG: hypothetical protein IJ342_00620 [Muribaculaceae bacterium]|nr:hypothetical protein [Muribaculaceae bacterium]